jgi:hypothetical protein
MVSFFFFLGKRKKEKGINWLIMRTKNSTQADLMDCIFMIKLKIVAKPEPTKLKRSLEYQTKILWICSRKNNNILTVAGPRIQPAARLKTGCSCTCMLPKSYPRANSSIFFSSFTLSYGGYQTTQLRIKIPTKYG